jgi:hypothetical protein
MGDVGGGLGIEEICVDAPVRKIEPAGALTAGRISRHSTDRAQLVRLSYLDADLSTAGARFAVRRLRRRLGEAKILAGLWQSDGRSVLVAI